MNQRGFIFPSQATMIVGAVLLAGNVLFYNLWQGAKEDEKLATATLSAERIQNKLDADKAKLDAERLNLDISNRWSDAVAHLHNNPVVRVLPCRDSGVSHGNAGTPGGLVSPFPPTSFDPFTITAAQCETELNAGIKDAADYEWAAYWVAEQLKKNPK